jgi:hypothetical protein
MTLETHNTKIISAHHPLKVVLAVVGIIIVAVFIAVLFPVANRSFTGIIHEYDEAKDEYTLIADNSSCSGSDHIGPWCYINCSGNKNTRYYLCKPFGEQLSFLYHGNKVTVLCPKNANYFNSLCLPVGIK